MGGMFSYARDLLGSKEMRNILILGLSRAGKTSILYRLKTGEEQEVITTIWMNSEQITYKNLKFQFFDLSAKPTWKHYYENTDAIIYVVDSTDRCAFESSKYELFEILGDYELLDTILIVLANKQDKEGCMSLDEVHKALNLDMLRNRKFQIFKTSVKNGESLYEAMDWLVNALRTRKITIKPSFDLPETTIRKKLSDKQKLELVMNKN